MRQASDADPKMKTQFTNQLVCLLCVFQSFCFVYCFFGCGCSQTKPMIQIELECNSFNYAFEGCIFGAVHIHRTMIRIHKTHEMESRANLTYTLSL